MLKSVYEGYPKPRNIDARKVDINKEVLPQQTIAGNGFATQSSAIGGRKSSFCIITYCGGNTGNDTSLYMGYLYKRVLYKHT